jgi:hypothetical protein
MMHNPFLSIKDAAQKYGKAQITIRRLIRSLTKDGRHRDRKYIYPGVSEVKELKKTQKTFAYAISCEFLDRLYQEGTLRSQRYQEDVASTPDNESKQTGSSTKIAIETLREQLCVKDRQIMALNQTLESLSERQRETNILMKGLQERLLIDTPKKRFWRLWKRG